ncbi:MAG: hypothetical protein ABIG34_03445 [Candidatus Peregrinibacteria bacterium]
MDLQTFSAEIEKLTALPKERMARALDIAKGLSDDDRAEFFVRLRDLAVSEADQEVQEGSLTELENAIMNAEKLLKKQERTTAERGDTGEGLSEIEEKLSQIP